MSKNELRETGINHKRKSKSIQPFEQKQVKIKQIKEQLEQTVLRKTQEKNGKSIKLDKESKATDMHINVKTNLKNCWFSHGTNNVKQSVDQVTHRQR